MDDSNAVSVDMETIYLGGKVIFFFRCFDVRILRFDGFVIIGVFYNGFWPMFCLVSGKMLENIIE